MSDNKWQQVIMSGTIDSSTTNKNDAVPFKECVTAIVSVTKTDALLPGMDGWN